MNLEWKLRLLLRVMAMSGFKPFHESTPEEARAREKVPQNAVTHFMLGKPSDLPAVEDVSLSGRNGPIPARVYRPQLNTPLPTIVFYHGGGWVVNSIDSYDTVCRRLTAATDHLVISVGYRLAPEHKFPAAVEDAYDALCGVAEQAADLGVDATRISVAGDSAGGNLAAVVAQLSRDQNGPAIAKQVLIYPATDSLNEYPSATTYAEAPILTKKDMDWLTNHYIKNEQDRADARCSPLLGRLDNLPPALILAAEYDPLVDQGKVYADALMKHNNQVTYKLYERQVHGFMSLGPSFGRSKTLFQDIAQFLS